MTETLKQKFLPADITSYDLIKSFAVIIMIIDHLGFYFFPDNMWFRSVGRVGFPVWFFLVGYSSGRDLPAKLVIGAAILVVLNYVVGLPVLPLNALATIMIIRVTIDFVMKWSLKNKYMIWIISVLFFILVLPTNVFTEYGTQAMITAMFGYLVRHRSKLENKDLTIHYMFFALITFLIIQQIWFHFSIWQNVVVIGGTMIVRYLLLNFKPESYPVMTKRLPGFISASMQFMGRRTLEIYVVHLAVFKIIAACMGYEKFSWFHFHWI